MANYITKNLQMVVGDTESFGFELSDSQGGAINLNTAYFSCKNNAQDPTYVFQKKLNDGITAAGNNQFIVRIAPEDTVLLSPGQYWYDLEIGVNNDIFTIFRGVLELVPEITDPNSIVYTSVEWGNITGTLSDQTDLQNALNAKANTASLAVVATSGSYNDLSDKPYIPNKTSDLTNDSNFVVSTDLATVATTGSYTDLINTPTFSQIANFIYPVGTYYWSQNSANPSTIFGFGTWTQITDKFIYAAGTLAVDTTGGEEAHTLTTEEIPSHRHTSGPHDRGVYGGNGGDIQNGGGWKTDMDKIYTGYTGGGQAHNNMPPYLVAYCWRRDA